MSPPPRSPPPSPASASASASASTPEEADMSGVLIIGIRKDARSHALHLSRNKRYTLTPEKLKWDNFKLTYKLLSFPRNLLNASDTRRGIAKAFAMWSDVSPFSFREVPADQDADIQIGVWLTDLVHVAAHEVGHALGLMHSQNPTAIMHLNATLTGRKLITQDDVWGLQRLYGCLDRLFICPAWARKGYCESKRRLMQKHCPYSCDFCYAFPFPTVAPTPKPPRTKQKLVAEGKKLTFRCGKKIAAKRGKVYWYKDDELLEVSHPGYISLKDDHLSLVANAINEGTYTCIVRKKNKVLTNYSWKEQLIPLTAGRQSSRTSLKKCSLSTKKQVARVRLSQRGSEEGTVNFQLGS
ncbi:hypothetical protein P4O66_003037 [Electrophorus voltai]|uniref:Matrix metallopeptidase 23B n=1 Tax=Electrophorus voltai TaxID=2609070 RepID=A0AAD9DN85_9TELE|nr:hypothetical protein P4O66_003037 [Electrophorus voltai]